MRTTCCSQRAKAPSTTSPAAIRKGTTEKPKGVISVPPIVSAPIGLKRPHVLILRIAKTVSPSPAADSAAPTPSSYGGAPARGRSPMR
jgi:hypothetical protein